MNFLEAVKTGRPIRRTGSGQNFVGPWIVIGESHVGGKLEHPWRCVDTGAEVTLASFDYTATDWQVQPCGCDPLKDTETTTDLVRRYRLAADHLKVANPELAQRILEPLGLL